MKNLMRVLICVCLLIFVQDNFAQQSYSWEEQARQIVVQADEIITDTSEQAKIFKESLQSMVKESFQVNDSYKKTTDSLQAIVKTISSENEKNAGTIKKTEELKLYFLAGAGAIVFILLCLFIFFLVRSGKLNLKYKKTAAELKDLNSTIVKIKEEEGQILIKNERLNTELKDCLEDVKSLDNKNKSLIESETNLKKENETLQNKLNELSSKISYVEASISERISETETLRSRINEISIQLNEKISESENLRKEINELKNQKENEIISIKEQKDKEILNLKTQISAKESEVITLNNEILSVRSNSAKEIEETNRHFAKMERDLSELRNEKSGMDEKLNAALKKAEEAQQNAAQFKAVTDSLHAEKQVMATEMTNLYNQSLILEGENKSLKAEIESLKAGMEKEIQARLKIDRELEKFVEELKGFLPLP